MMKLMDIDREVKYLEECLNRVTEEMGKLKDKVPDGARLRAARCKNSYQYFMRIQGTGMNGKYIKSKDRKTAEILAQIEYDEKLLIVLNRMLDILRRLQKDWIDNPFCQTLNRMIAGKRELVSIPYVSNDAYVVNWKAQEYEGLIFREGIPEYYTRKGLRVRSKSEVIIADILDELNVPFLYEKPLKLKTGIVHPDFTLLNIKERREVYWEHFGMMDDIEYRNNAMMKIRKYEASGLYQYDSVIWTFETGSNPINTKDIRKMIIELKKRLGY